MSSSHAVFATLLLLGSVSAAEAATVTENLVGQVAGSNTVDTLGLFGPAGANLVNQPISIYFKYTTEDFTSQKTGRNGYVVYNSQGSSSTPGSVLITVTINGKRQVYAPAYQGVVFIPTAAPYSLTIDSDAYSGFGDGLTGAQTSVQFLSAPTFGSPLSPTDNPVLNSVVDSLSFFTPSSSVASEQLSFFVSSASK